MLGLALQVRTLLGLALLLVLGMALHRALLGLALLLVLGMALRLKWLCTLWRVPRKKRTKPWLTPKLRLQRKQFEPTCLR